LLYTFTMDLLGSIMGSMTAPPGMSQKEKEKRKKMREMQKKMEEKTRADTQKFREDVEKKINSFITDEKSAKLEFPVMEKFQRSILHDVCEVAGLVAYSFGEEDVDRHTVVWKKESAPAEEELACLRAGKRWDPDEHARAKVAEAAEEEARRNELVESRKRKKVVPKSNYRDKYAHLTAGADDVARVGNNSSYGMVSAEEKKDRRTVEDIQAEIREKKKRQKLEEGEEEGVDNEEGDDS